MIRFYDPGPDIERRADLWGLHLNRHDLSSLAGFAAGLAEEESRAWKSGAPDLAMRAYEARRFLLADRIMHWAVPWLDAVSRACPAYAAGATSDRDGLLALGDEMRAAPLISGREGLRPEGEDAYGPTGTVEEPGWFESLWSGVVLLGFDRAPADRAARPELAAVYQAAAARWMTMAANHAGSAELWSDLADRAAASARWLGRA